VGITSVKTLLEHPVRTIDVEWLRVSTCEAMNRVYIVLTGDIANRVYIVLTGVIANRLYIVLTGDIANRV
jgi:hypothetical protein